MAYCPKCGVEVETKKCPLCSYVIKQDIHKIPFSHYVVNLEKSKVKLTKKEKKSIGNASTLFFAILISAICITINIYKNHSITWAYFPTIVTFSIALITAASLYIKGVFKIISILALHLLMLFLIDLLIPGATFFIEISLPITAVIAVISLTVTLVIIKSKKRSVNIPGYIILGIAFLLIFIDLIVQNFNQESLSLTWSLITTVSLTPISIFLLYIHYIFSKRVDLTKIFHT